MVLYLLLVNNTKQDTQHNTKMGWSVIAHQKIRALVFRRYFLNLRSPKSIFETFRILRGHFLHIPNLRGHFLHFPNPPRTFSAYSESQASERHKRYVPNPPAPLTTFS